MKKNISIGTWLTIPNEAIAEILSKADYDWICIDMEHSPITLESAEKMIRVIDLAGNIPYVRVPDHNPTTIKRVLDMGAQGLIVPQVNTKKEMEEILSAARYPPLGNRGVGLARAQEYGVSFDEYKEFQNQIPIIPQIEHWRGVDNLVEIMDVDESIDTFFVGPYDLSASIGHPGEFSRQGYINAMQTIKQHSNTYRAGIHQVMPNPEEIVEKIHDGYEFIAYSTDFLILGETARNDMSYIKEELL